MCVGLSGAIVVSAGAGEVLSPPSQPLARDPGKSGCISTASRTDHMQGCGRSVCCVCGRLLDVCGVIRCHCCACRVREVPLPQARDPLKSQSYLVVFADCECPFDAGSVCVCVVGVVGLKEFTFLGCG